MSFGNFQLHRLDHGQRHDHGRYYDRRQSQGRGIESGQRLQPIRESSATLSGKSQTNLTVVTAEGDRVIISLAAQLKSAAASQTGRDGSSQAVSTSVSSQLRVAVQGDLSETELKDLGALLSTLSKATSQAQSTGVPDASAFTANFSSLQSLAAFAYSYNQTVEARTLFYI